MTDKCQEAHVFVAMSGGVDSSVAAALLKEAGYDVTGVFMRVYQPDFLECTRTDDRREAMRAAAHLGIPFLTFDFQEEYKEKVVDYMIREYRAGRTPNPDIMCNKHIKFDLFLKKAREMGADFVATGHYVRLRQTTIDKEQLTIDKKEKRQMSDVKCQMLVGRDSAKDQSYFLWTLTQEQLKYCLFPIGGYTKPQVRKMARKFGLPNAERRDSQGVCFIGQFPMKEFLKKYIPPKDGVVLNEDGGIIGTHDGAWFFTLGERHGFTITKKTPNDPPRYIIAKDIQENTITVASETARDGVTEAHLIQTNFISGETPNTDKTYSVRFRYRQQLQEATIVLPKTYNIQHTTYNIQFVAPQHAVTPGQSLVLYRGDECIGGGIIV